MMYRFNMPITHINYKPILYITSAPRDTWGLVGGLIRPHQEKLKERKWGVFGTHPQSSHKPSQDLWEATL